ncbi:sensor histidine kinase [Peterkaempfera sp. SMS 1(5)a]|uniref:sensor histidine kinase n=1 Tax=Peterkaempfera podocarpi TaxID=3232308 RepID=UPI00366F797E
MARITEEPILNILHVAPLMLIAFAASSGRRTTLRRRQLERERSRARRDGEERERRRWARELHDDTLQELGAVQVVLASAAAGGQPSAIREAIDQARSLVSNQIASLRHLISELRPAVLDQLGLRPAIEALCRRVSETFGVQVDIRVAPDWDSFAGGLSSEAQVHVYRIVQEAVTNAVKHADPQSILVELHGSGRVLTASVTDDGTGMPPHLGGPKPPSTGMGLWDMRERADLLDAQLRISTSAGGGTRVTLRVPQGRGTKA